MTSSRRRSTLRPAASKSSNRMVALYCRVSSEEQAEAENIQVQLDFLQRYCQLHDLHVAGEYLDDGVSGTIPLSERPHGARLLHDARRGDFGTVLFMRVNRFARRLSVALDGYEQLEAAGVAIKSGTEPIDTSDPVGRFVFQLLGAFAELDRETIIDNTTRGRARGARNGRWYGVVPLGYLVQNGRLTPNMNEIAPGIVEADLVAGMFERIAGGSSGVKEVVRLTGLGIQPFVRYAQHDGRELMKRGTGGWILTRITRMIRNPLYKGTRTFRGCHGEIPQDVPALVSDELWQRANQQLTDNRRLSKRNATHAYLMRGLIRCGRCHSAYRGTFVTKSQRRYYQCGHLALAIQDESGDGPARRRCGGKAIPAAWLEHEIWMACQAFLSNPGPVLEEARKQYIARSQVVEDVGERRNVLEGELADSDSQRDAIIRMARRGLLQDHEVESQLAEIARDRRTTNEQLDAVLGLEYEAELSRQQEQSIERLLARIRVILSEGVDDQIKADVIRMLVDRIVVETEGNGPTKRAQLHVYYRFPGLEEPADGWETAGEVSIDLRTA